MTEDLKKYIRHCTLAVVVVVGFTGIMNRIEHKAIENKIDQLRTNQRIQDSNDPNELYDINRNKAD